MAVTFDAVVEIRGEGVTTLTTAAFTVGSGSNRAGAVGLSFSANNPTAITTDIGGVSGILVPGSDSLDRGSNNRTMIFALVAPPSGSQTATASWTTAMDCILGAVTVSGNDQVTPMNGGVAQGVSSNSANPALTVPSVSGDLTLGVLSENATPSAPTQTERWSDAFNIFGRGSTGAGAGSDTHKWTAASSLWAISGANFRAPDSILPGGGPADDRFRFRPSVFWSGTSTLGTKRSPWPDDALDFGMQDTIDDSRSRLL